jgi:NAD(P)-dependent dehydrogenase (short-subunit alcohol dehydrogenase family)
MQYVLVTGAYGGMGKATVNALKNAGYTVFALDKKVLEKEENVLPVQADVTSLESLEKAFEYVKSITDELFAIIHFAGIYTLNSLVEITDEEFCRAFEINVFGAYRINKLFLPLLKKGSKILLTTSELAPLDPLPFTSLYAVTKSTLDKYAYSLRMELQLLGISVAVLRAGAVDTGMLGVSTDALNNFCENTKIYKCNAKNFKSVVDKVESRKIPPEKIAKKVVKIVNSKRMKYVYNVNRNPLLLLLNALPDRLQTWIIKKIIE